MNVKSVTLGLVAILLFGGTVGLLWDRDCAKVTADLTIKEMLEKVDQDNIHDTVYALQNFTSRYYGYSGNSEAATYLFDRLSNISGLNVKYQGGSLRNVIATLPGKYENSSNVIIVGAHYDSVNRDLSNAPGATDNGGGVAIVLELARVMSQYSFNHTLVFALWNAEEGGAEKWGSVIFAEEAASKGLDISLYFNFDSACYDPENKLVLDLMYNDRSRCIADMIVQNNRLYDIGFTLTHNVHTCMSDHRSFWAQGFAAVMTHEQEHGPAHTSDDTVDKISTLYAMKNGQIGMSVLAYQAGVNGRMR